MGVLMDKFIVNLIEEIQSYLPHADAEGVLSAYEISEKIYAEAVKKDPANYFIVRPRNIVKELLHFRPDEDTIIAAFLYDFPDAGDQYGDEVKELLGVLRIIKSIKVVRYQSADKIDLFRKLFMAMAKDIRVIVVFLAVKVVQMRLLDKLPRDCCEFFAKDVMDVFAPIAARLGVHRYKTLLEDLSFKHLYPEEYKKTCRDLEKFGKKRGEYIETVSGIVRKFLEENGFEGVQVDGRLKSLYSVFAKMKRKELLSVDEIFDIFAIRVILPASENVSELYEVLGLLHTNWRPIPSRFKDFVAVPKPNGYQSLHTALVGLSDGEQSYPVEVQIRSSAMHEEAEYGVASHWLYKDVSGRKALSSEAYLEWVARLTDLHKEMQAEESVLDSIKTDVFNDRIYVLTPKGDVKDLSKGATPLDFAYLIHTDVGHRCVLAKVNNKVVPFDTQLKSGDTVEIVTKKDGVPKLEWLAIVKTGVAKVRIRSWFSAQDEQRHFKLGRDQLNVQLIRYGKSILDPQLQVLKKFAGQSLSYDERVKILVEIGKGTQTASGVIRNIYNMDQLSRGSTVIPAGGSGGGSGKGLPSGVLVAGLQGITTKVAQCCNPTNSSNIIGYVSSKSVVTIHRTDCKLIERFQKPRFVPVQFHERSDIAKKV